MIQRIWTIPLGRERAMLSGMVTDRWNPQPLPEPTENVLDEVDIQGINASYHDGILDVSQRTAADSSLTDRLIDQPAGDEDVYIEMYVQLLEPDKRFTINVDGYENDRLFSTSKYRTYADDLLYRAELREELPVGFSAGRYTDSIQAVHRGLQYTRSSIGNT